VRTRAQTRGRSARIADDCFDVLIPTPQPRRSSASAGAQRLVEQGETHVLRAKRRARRASAHKATAWSPNPGGFAMMSMHARRLQARRARTSSFSSSSSFFSSFLPAAGAPPAAAGAPPPPPPPPDGTDASLAEPALISSATSLPDSSASSLLILASSASAPTAAARGERRAARRRQRVARGEAFGPEMCVHARVLPRVCGRPRERDAHQSSGCS
jgi:hypothetical protein